MTDKNNLRVVSGAAIAGEAFLMAGGQIELALVRLEDNSFHVLFTKGGGAGFNLGLEVEFIASQNATLGDLIGRSTEISGGFLLGVEVALPGQMTHAEALQELAQNGFPDGAFGGATFGPSGGFIVGHNDTSDLGSLSEIGINVLSALGITPLLPLVFGHLLECFGSDTPIDMWPLDPSLKPGSGGVYDQGKVCSKIWQKPIELIEVGDIVVSFDEDGNLVPGPVTRTFQNDAKILLNFHGTRVTPGHVYYRPDSKRPYKYETLIDVLRDDGVIQHQDGTLIRAATNVPVDHPCDGFVRAVTGMRQADGNVITKSEGRIRLGTRFLVGEGKDRKSWAIADLIEAGGGVVGDDEMIRVGDGDPLPFYWEFGDTLPAPEDFVLACSGTTREEIYKAAEWESQGPRLPAPMVLDRGPVQPLSGAALSAMPRNEPLDVLHAPMTERKPQGKLNRKQRKAMEAKRRKAAKA